jgi:hypothetical protein
MAAYMDSFSMPPRAPIEIDLDSTNESDGTRLIRRKTTSYSSHNQLAAIRFLYEKYKEGRAVESYIDDFASHVFFPRELRCCLSIPDSRWSRRSVITGGGS